MAKKIKGIVLEIGGDTQPLNKALEGANKQSRDLQSELRQVERLLKLDPKNTELLAQKQKLLTDAVSNTKEKLDTLREAEKQVQEQFKRGEINEEQYRALQREIIKTEQELKKLEGQLKTTGMTAEQLGKKFKDTGSKMSDIGKSMTTKVTAPIMAAGAGLVAVGATFDDVFDNIRIGTGATGEALEALKEDFRAVARDTPAAFGDIGTAIADYNTRLGLTGKELQDISRQTLELARITGTDLSKMIEETSQSFMAFNVPAEQYGDTLDFVFKVSQDTGIGMDRMLSNMVKFAPALKQLNIGFEESAVLMGSLDKAGVDVEQTLAGLTKAIATMAKKGITDTNEAIKMLFDDIKNAPTDIEGTQAALEIFGARAGPALASAIREGKLEYTDLVEQLKNSKETILGVAGETKDWTESIVELKNKLLLALEPLAERFFGAINDLIPILEKLAGFVTQVVEAFVNLSPETQTIILAITAFVAAIGPLLMVFGPLISGIGTLITGLGAMSAAMTGGAGIVAGLTAGFPALGAAIAVITGPIGLVIAAIAVLVAAGVLIYKNWDKIKETLDKVWGAIVNFFTKTIPEAINTGLKWFSELPGKVAKFMNELPGKIGYALGVALGKVIQFGIDAINWAIAEVPKFIASIIRFYMELPGKIWEQFRVALSRIQEWGVNLISWARGNLPGIISDIVSFFRELPGRLLEIGKDIVRGLWNGISSMIGWIRDKISDFVGGIVSGVKGVLGISSPSRVFMNIGENVSAGLAEGIKGAKAAVDNAVAGLVTPQINVALAGDGAGSTSPGVGAITNTFAIQNMNVRDDRDIKLIARELYNLQNSKGRGLGLA